MRSTRAGSISGRANCSARIPNYYRKPDALEIELVKLYDRRDYKPPKWFTDP